MIPKEFAKTTEYLNQLQAFEKMYEIEDEGLNQYIVSQKGIDIYKPEPEEQCKLNINESFIEDYAEFERQKAFFYGCSFSNYESNYNKRLLEFRQKYLDSLEKDFIYEELKALINYTLPNYMNDELVKSIFYSIERCKEYLISKLEKEGFLIQVIKNEDGNLSLNISNNYSEISISKSEQISLRWQKNKTDFVELTMALISSECINVGGVGNLSERQFYDLFSQFFNVEKLNHERIKQNIRDRVKDETIFIPLLDHNLKQAIQNKTK